MEPGTPVWQGLNVYDEKTWNGNPMIVQINKVKTSLSWEQLVENENL